jgi:hypothetical protein
MPTRSTCLPACAALAALALALALGGCAGSPPRATVRERAAVPEPPMARIYVYPANGQDAERTDRDRYECHLWAVRQSGYDPADPQLPRPERIRVESGPPPGTGTVAGAAAGAVIGAVAASPGNSGGGAIVGAIAGAVLGTAADAARQYRVERVQERVDARDRERYGAYARGADEYRRALGACLTGRQYTVK